MGRIAVIVPVSPFEPAEIVEKSAVRIKSLDYANHEVRILYVVDIKNNDSRPKILRSIGVEVLERKDSRGKRAGAINDAVRYFEEFNPDYVAIFDVDSIPEKDFVLRCIEGLERNPDSYIASTPRYISNPVNFCSETISAEYMFINFLLSKSAFKQFNGLIGVLKWEVLSKYRLDEDFLTEDAEFATRMHSIGYKAVLVRNSKILEQAPLSWKELYFQRRRWYFGGIQLWKHFNIVRRANFGFKLSWMLSLTLPYIVILFLPLLVLSPPLILYKFRKISKLKLVAGIFIHIFILQFSAIMAIYDFLRRKESAWHPQKRVI
jgi:cellulose synthase/poly-beta-1,6-N-acetylglucosamine synthase-like glycosyltransferase